MGLVFRKRKRLGRNTALNLSKPGASVSRKAGPVRLSSRGRGVCSVGQGSVVQVQAVTRFVGMLVALLVAALLVASPADAKPKKGCVTWHEYDTVYKGWPKGAVERHFGTHGHVSISGSVLVKKYPGCHNGPVKVVVRYKKPDHGWRWTLAHKRPVY
jgi:hypothetical protein